MTPQTARDTFSRSSLLLLCGLSGMLAFQGGLRDYWILLGFKRLDGVRWKRSSLHRVLGHSTRNYYETQGTRNH